MITAEMAERLIDTGLNAVCAWCEHYHDALDRPGGGMVSCGKDCGGPAMGRAFPRYKGPMEGYLYAFCLICGKSSDATLDIGGRSLGICNRQCSDGATCMEKIKGVLARKKVVVKERVVPIVGDGD